MSPPVKAYRIVEGELDIRPFKDDVELLSYLRLPDDARGRAMVAALPFEARQAFARVRAIAECLNAGRIPRCALVSGGVS